MFSLDNSDFNRGEPMAIKNGLGFEVGIVSVNCREFNYLLNSKFTLQLNIN